MGWNHPYRLKWATNFVTCSVSLYYCMQRSLPFHRMRILTLLLLMLSPLLCMAQRHRRDTTFVKVQAERVIDSKIYRHGNTCVFVVTDDVYVGDSLIIEKGARAYGTVTLASKARSVGEPGILEIKPDYVEGVSRDYDLSGPLLYSEGRERKLASCLLGALVFPGFLLLKGQEAHIYPTTVIEIGLVK